MSENRSSPFLDLCRRRVSCRAYRPDAVPREHIETMLEAARQAPSACNRQPWRFCVVTDPQVRRQLTNKGILPGLCMDWIAGAPVLVAMGIERSTLIHRVAPLIAKVDYPWVDLGIAGEHLVLQATELGLGTCWIGWIRPGGVRKVVDWPRSVRPVALLTVGYPQEDAGLRMTERRAMEDISRWM